MDWMLMPYRRYFDFSGRSRRKEYWMFVLFQIIVAFVLMIPLIAGMATMDQTDPQAQPGGLFWIGAGLLGLFFLASFIPSIAVAVRRFHDQDKSGWFYLISFVPYIGGLIVLVFMCLEGTRGPNRFGADPKDPNSVSVFS